jgi:hypothetical protein
MVDYSIKFRCPNCLTVFDKRIPKGQPAGGNAGSCPGCGCDENTVVRGTGQKLGRFQVVPPVSKGTKGNRFEFLLEADGVKIKKIEDK